ncbi:MAG: signal peptide peptidase SppA [Planctomycetota bacterium]|jgi:protease-4
MDFEHNDEFSEPVEQQPEKKHFQEPKHLSDLPVVGAGPDKPPKRRSAWRVFWSILFVLSILANIVLFLAVVGTIGLLVSGREGVFTEEVIREGPHTSKIAVVRLDGIIEAEKADEVYRQLKRAREDDNVKGIILRVDSPGGTVSGSDRIYNEIKNRTDKPVVAFMEGVAASGGYYASVACEKIVAEPTTITGSIGVIVGYLVVKDLLEGKLGVQPVIIKSGTRKDWPSSFRYPEEEERHYLEEKLIEPVYERFVEVVAEGRKDLLTLTRVRKLADGSIYGAQEAKDENLIDEIGYLDEAIEQAKLLAQVKKAQVVEYRKPFSFSQFLRSQGKSTLKIDTSTLYELTTPQRLYLCTTVR